MSMPFTPCGNAQSAAECTDKSVEILRHIFGPAVDQLAVGADPASVDTMNILTAMFSVFNSGLLVVGSLIISFVALVGAVNTANDGEAMGKTWSAWWTPIRIFSGAFALLPTASGLSMIQLGILLFSLWGIGFANSIYKAGMDEAALNPEQMVRASVEKPNMDYGVRQFARNYLQISYCKYISNTIVKSRFLGSNRYPDIGRKPGGHPDREIRMTIFTPNGFTPRVVQRQYDYADRSKTTNFGGGKPICGMVSEKVFYSPDNYDRRDQLDYALDLMSTDIQLIKLKYMNELIKKIDEFTQTWPTRLHDKDSSVTDDEAWKRVNAAKFNEIIDGIEKEIRNEIAKKAQSKETNLGQAFNAIQEALTDGGWSMAGGWYHRVGRLQSRLNTMYSEQVMTAAPVTQSGATFDGAASEEILVLLMTAPEAMLSRAERAANYQPVSRANPDLESAFPVGVTALNVAKVKAGLNDQMSTWSNSAMKGIVETFIGTGDSNGKGVSNRWFDGWTCGDIGKMGGSLVRIQCAGEMIANAHAALILADTGLRTLLTTVRIGAGVLSSVKIFGNGVDLNKIVDPVWDLANSLLTMLATMVTRYLGIFGFYFSVFIPSYPYIIFITVVVAWILAVLQSLIAAPLWAMMFVTPDRTFVGSQTQGMLLILSLFIRPALSIIGLFAALIVADPVIAFVTESFFNMRASIITSTSGDFSFSQWTTFFWWLAAYGLTLLPILYMAFGLASGLPDQVLKWIGGGVSDLGEAGAINAARSGITAAGTAYIGASSAARGAAASVTHDNQQARSARIEQRKKERDAEKDMATVSENGQGVDSRAGADGNSGTGNSGTGNSGTGNSGTGNSGTGNSGTGNSGTGNSGTGNSGNSNPVSTGNASSINNQSSTPAALEATGTNGSSNKKAAISGGQGRSVGEPGI